MHENKNFLKVICNRSSIKTLCVGILMMMKYKCHRKMLAYLPTFCTYSTVKNNKGYSSQGSTYSVTSCIEKKILHILFADPLNMHQ